ncbi:class II fructose-bisphosphate aldolase [Thermoanaerobacterium sp. RBIITD]|uniref:class II fructose-bisphosphate aldolase n=1 Tax=Thermoanaerobacterium sp. RBIITD TaxID=1550240 RepID=UPI000BB77542|nr:class II fructose-bisphosphate aldolase [Thermoanaerobacterium sp. RBIITD]SNX54682.1 fructose-bisphosphate aldolase, class II [Thermoanaerobacterium sp. RBIITD]
MLVSGKNILNDAKKNKYAVGAFNVINDVMIRATVDAAVELQSPIILEFAEIHFKHSDFELIAKEVVTIANRVEIPVALHLDHCKDFNNFIKAIKFGFTSFMYDGSSLPYEQNVKMTKQVTDIAHSLGYSVEGEIGHVGEGVEYDLPQTSKLFTTPEDASKFAKETGIDFMAVAFGSAHGIYKSKPNLDINLLKKINNVVDILLVLHGGSRLTDDDFKNCIKNGICKINYFTELSLIAKYAIRELINDNDNIVGYPEILDASYKVIKERVKNRILLFGSNGMA